MCMMSDEPVGPGLPDTGQICCEGVAFAGPEWCTCWVEVYDLDQTAPDPATVRLLEAGIEPVTRSRMCGDCAYRPESPERSEDPTYKGGGEFLDELAATGDRFWCHQDMRRPRVLRHPSGMEIPGHPAAYRPPIVNGIPYRADGQPGELCAGWAAHRRRHQALSTGEAR